MGRPLTDGDHDDLRSTPTGDGRMSLHDAVITVSAPAFSVSDRDGQLRGRGAEGIYVADRRVLRDLVVLVDGAEVLPVSASVGSTDEGPCARFVGVGAVEDDGHGDPALHVERTRSPYGRDGQPGPCEQVTLRNHTSVSVSLTLAVRAGCDLADVFEVREGRPPDRRACEPVSGGGLRWSSADAAVTLTASPSPGHVDASDGLLSWRVDLPPQGTWTVRLALDVEDRGTAPPAVTRPIGPAPWSRLEVDAGDHRLGSLVRRSLADLESLLLADPEAPSDLFLGAGAPWYLTLFGRDALWAARMLLPLGTDLAAGTLRTLARRQGAHVDPHTEEAPGKILHELRRAETAGARLSLPPRYYGTVDATPLFVCLLADAWRWGMPADEVEPLLPAAESALTWMREHGDPDGDGFLEYAPTRAGGLANQGWKDSVDAVQFADGSWAAAPVALAEVQGYAYEAAVRGADLLDAFTRPGGDAWRDWAAGLRDRFRSRFWVTDGSGPFPAIALDRDKRPVDTVTSNMGHLLATGLLDADECAHVAARLSSPEMDSGYGLRTMASGDGSGAAAVGYNPLGYHTGSVWPHDTAIVASGLAATGHVREAVSLLHGLVEAAPAFAYRLPELYGGNARAEGTPPLAYPRACHPQAWAAAAAVSLVGTLLGLDVDVPAGRVRVDPPSEQPFGRLHVRGLRVGAELLDIRVPTDPPGP